MNKLYTWIAVAALSAGIAFVSPSFAQAPGGAKGGAPKGKAPATNLPTQPIAVPLPTMSAKITGPGPMYDSAVSQWPGRDVNFYKYETNEYFLTGTANGKPYKTRMVVRQPSDKTK